jgi:hypothetical protein
MPYRKPTVRPPKVRPREKKARDRERFRAMYKGYGIEQLIQWYIEDDESPSRVGRPRRVFSWFMPLSEPVRANRPTPKRLSHRIILSDILKRLGE